MRRRGSGNGSTVGGERREVGKTSAEAEQGWAVGWADAWGEGEEERVARWLTAKGRVAIPGPSGEPGRARPVDPWVTADDLDLLVGPTPAAPPAPAAPAPAVPFEAERRRAEQLHAEQLRAKSVLEAEVAFLEDERRRLAAALVAERSEAERAHRERARAVSMIEEQVTRLEQDRRRILSGTEAAVAAADRARADEREAREALEAARAEARVVEAKHFEVWIALEAEVSALTARRRRLRALRHRRPAPALPPTC